MRLERINCQTGIKSENGQVIIEVTAGENRSDFVERCCENNYCGIENLIDIP